jgi:hypothetical protein
MLDILGCIITCQKRRDSQHNGNSLYKSTTKKKFQTAAGKQMATSLLDLQGILLKDWLSTGMMINSGGYCES